MKQNSQKGSATVIAVVLVLLLGVATAGWFVWSRGKSDDTKGKSTSINNQGSGDPTKDWSSFTSQAGGFSMRIPDGWKVTSYPGDFLGSTDVDYQSGKPASIQTEDKAYAGHLLRFRVSVAPIDDAGLGPQWSSPQQGLEESVGDFNLGKLSGKRYKGEFTQDLKQTIYEYVFGLSGKRKLDIVYTVNHRQDESDDIATVEKAIRTVMVKAP